jgi:hypothetical protein
MGHGSWFMVHGSWVMDHGSWFMLVLIRLYGATVAYKIPNLRVGGGFKSLYGHFFVFFCSFTLLHKKKFLKTMIMVQVQVFCGIIFISSCLIFISSSFDFE